MYGERIHMILFDTDIIINLQFVLHLKMVAMLNVIERCIFRILPI